MACIAFQRETVRRSNPMDRFFGNIEIADDGCWMWTGAVRGDGYGQMKIHVKPIAMHRYSWELFRGEIPEGKLVLHKCDVPLCVNPSHLFVGTNKDNMDDMARKGRRNAPKGSGHVQSKLNESDIKEIRLFASLGYSQPKIAAMYGVSRSNIGFIANRQTWKHVK